MSVVGIDLGNLNTVIAVARNRGIDVICNEVSNRATPSLVAFGPKNRFLGEAAKSQEVSNLKNTVGNFKRLIGRRVSDEEFVMHERQFLSYRTEEHQGMIGVRVNYLGEERIFTPLELAAMFLGKVRETTCAELQSNAVQDIVLSCPVYFNDPQRRALMDAAEIAGLRCVRLLNDTTAAALAYGMTKAADLSEEVARTVCFVDMGHSNLSVSIVNFWKSKMEVKAVAYDPLLGGRSFDEALAQCIANEILETRKIDIRSSPKAMYRLRAAAERAKKILSANSKTPVHVESIAEEQDFATDFTRERFEGLIGTLVDRVEIVIGKALADAGVSSDAVHSIELIGGSVRIPAVKERISRVFLGREPGATMNQDEAVARGCALQAAILSPTFKSRPFSIQDAAVVPVRMSWEPTIEEPEDRDAIVFPLGNALPSTKLLSFSRPLPFDISVSSGIDGRTFSAATVGQSDQIIQGTVGSIIKVKAKMSPCHLVSIESAQLIEEIVEQVTIPSAEASSQEPLPAQAGHPKKTLKKTDIPVVFVHSGLPGKELEQLREAEGAMAVNDKLVKDTADAKNALEEYIYACRSKIDGKHGEWTSLVTGAEWATLNDALEKVVEWLYDEGYDVTKSIYQEKLANLKAIGDPIAKRRLEEERRSRAVANLQKQIYLCSSFAGAECREYEHIEEDDRAVVMNASAKSERWLQDALSRQSSLKPWDKAAVSAADIEKEQDNLIKATLPIMTKPKPTAKPESEQNNTDKHPEKDAGEDSTTTTSSNEDFRTEL